LDQNLTFIQNVIRAHTPDALEGHVVVVLEKVGTGGEAFRYELRPGQTPPKRMLNLLELLRGETSGPGYVAFAVTDNSELRASTTADIRTDDQKHAFTVTLQLSFKVANPRLLVARRNDDPVQRMNEEAAAVVAQELARKEWSDLRQSFRATEQEVVSLALPALQKFATNYGLSIEKISLQCQLGEQDMRLIEQEAQADLDTERQKIALRQAISLRSMQATVKAQERQDKVFDAAADAAAAAIANVPGSIRTVAELAKSFETLARYSGNEENFSRRVLAASTTSCEGITGAGVVITDMLMETEKLSCGLSEKRYAQSSVLHLIAELLREDPDFAVVDTYRQRIVTLSSPVHSTEQIEALERFAEADVDLLRGQLC
jgi:hypothetical protein